MYQVNYIGYNGGLITCDFKTLKEAKHCALANLYSFISITTKGGEVIYSGIRMCETAEPYFYCDINGESKNDG